MNNIYNTSLEKSMRVLLQLYIYPKTSKSLDMLTLIDFIAIYGKKFEISHYNLHGDSPYNFSEFCNHRNLTSKALKTLVLYGLIEIESNKNGFYYKITPKGILIIKKLSTKYSKDYLYLVTLATKYTEKKSEEEIFKIVNNKTAMSIKTGDANE